MTHRFSIAVSLAVSVLMLAGSVEAGQRPGGVSPGAPDRAQVVEGRCPAFSWVEHPEAATYELVVYELWDQADQQGTFILDLERATEVVYTIIPGGASSWTPALKDCLIPGGSFVWFVRAILEPETGETSEWSEPLLFSVAAGPSALEVEHALTVLERYLDNGGDEGLDAEPGSRSAAQAAGSYGRASTQTPKSTSRSVLNGTAAIRGEQPDPAGETYGVVGMSASPDGAGLGAANTGGGPDLVLDGSANGAADAVLREAGIDRSSASPQTFAFENTAGGGITLEIEGVEVVTTETDSDVLAGLGCTGGEVAKWNGASWVCAPDVDTDTLAGLGPLCDSGEIAAWNGSAWVCAEDADTLGDVHCPPFLTNRVAKWDGSQWSCGQDDDTTYTPGPGLIIVGDEIRLDPAAFSARATTLHEGGVGTFTSLAIGSDGLGLMSYYDATNDDLWVLHCEDVFCSFANHASVIDAPGDVGRYCSLAIGADGLGLIAYRDDTDDDLKVAHCDDVPCTTATITTVDSAGSVGSHGISLAIGTDGFGLISYYDSTNSALKVAHCDNALCTSAGLTTLDNSGLVGRYSSMAIGSDGLGLITYLDLTTGGRLKITHCNNAACDAATLSTSWFLADSSTRSSVVIGSDGRGLITWGPWYSMYFFHCDDVECSSATLSNAGDHNVVEPSLAIGADGVPMLSFYDGDADSLAVARCDDITCATALVTTVDSVGDVGRYNSLAVGTDERGLVSYYDSTNQNLKIIHLPVGL